MLGFNPNTQPVAMKEWVTPLDPSVYAQGVANQAKKLEAQSTQDSELYNSFMNIQAIAPQDEEQLQKLKQSFEKELSGLTMGDLRNPQTKAQLSQIQNKYTNLLLESGIPQRTSSFKQELAAKKDAEAKGRQYVSPLLRQAEKYIQDGNFYKDTRFNQQGFVAPDNKELDEIAKNTPEWENWVTEGGYDIHKKGKAESSLYNNYLTHFTNNPQWSALLNDQFEQQIENLDLNEVVSQGLNGIEQLFPNLPPEKQQEALNDLQQGLAMQQSNPYLQSAVKDKLRNDYFRNQAYMAAQAKTYVNTVDKKQNAYAKDAIDFQQAKDLELYKKQLEEQYPKQESKQQASSLGFDTIDNVISNPQNYGKLGQDGSIILKEIPAIFNSDIYSLGNKSITKEVTNSDGSISKVTTNEKTTPKQVTYNPATSKFRLYYGDGNPAKYVTKQEIINDVAIENPSLAKYLKNESNSEYSNLTQGTDAQGNEITLGVKNGKWYNINTGQEYK